MSKDKITCKELQDLYEYHFRHSTSPRDFPVRFFRRKEIFKRMAEDLNTKYNLGKELL